MGSSLWGLKESDMTELLTLQHYDLASHDFRVLKLIQKSSKVCNLVVVIHAKELLTHAVSLCHTFFSDIISTHSLYCVMK